MLHFFYVMMHLLQDLVCLVSKGNRKQFGSWKVLTIYLHINLKAILINIKITWYPVICEGNVDHLLEIFTVTTAL